MAEKKYPYTNVPGRLRDFLSSIPGWGTPDGVTVNWLEGVGYRGGSGRSVLAPLKFVGVLQRDGTPAEGWKALRSGKPGRVEFANLVRSAYADLFKTYPDAHRRDTEALRNFFRANTTVGEDAQAKMLQTFKVLTEFGDFEAGPVAAGQTTSADQAAQVEAVQVPQLMLPNGAAGLTLNVDIQLQLPATSEGEVYEKLFAAMRKHLIDLTKS